MRIATTAVFLTVVLCLTVTSCATSRPPAGSLKWSKISEPSAAASLLREVQLAIRAADAVPWCTPDVDSLSDVRAIEYVTAAPFTEVLDYGRPPYETSRRHVVFLLRGIDDRRVELHVTLRSNRCEEYSIGVLIP